MVLDGITSEHVVVDAGAVTGTAVLEDDSLLEEAFSDVLFTALSCCRDNENRQNQPDTIKINTLEGKDNL